MDVPYLFIHLSVDGHFSCSQLWSVTHEATMNIKGRILCGHMLHFLLRKYLGGEGWGHWPIGQ